MIIIGDVHGNLKTLKALLNKIPEEEKAKGVCFTGDLIDRGPSSRQVIEFVRANNYICTRGNHEDMMVGEYQQVLSMMASGRAWYTQGLWILNGGSQTIDSYMEEVTDDEGNTFNTFAWDVFEEHIEWAKQLPLFKEFPTIVNDDNKFLVIAHTYFGGVWSYRNKPMEWRKVDFEYQCIWHRPYKFKDTKEAYIVIGHTPIKNGPKIKSFYANIDTGCFYNGEPGYFKLTALQFPEMIVYQQENIDKNKS